MRRIKKIVVTAILLALAVCMLPGEHAFAAKQHLRFLHADTYSFKVKSKESDDYNITNYYTYDHNDGNSYGSSPIDYFFEPDGTLTLVYAEQKYARMIRFDGKTLKKKDELKLKKPIKYVEGAVMDEDGYYYLAFSEPYGTYTFAVAKYDHAGKQVGIYRYSMNDDKNDPYNGLDSTAGVTGGNFSMSVKDGLVICYFGRAANNRPSENSFPYQTSAVYAINTADMSRNFDYFMWSSISCDERVFKTSEGKWLFADLNSGTPGFTMGYSGEEVFETFHVKNTRRYQTYVGLGNVLELPNGFALLGYAPKDTEEGKNEADLFLQIVNKSLNYVISSGETRVTRFDDRTVYDNGIIWLTKDGDKKPICGCNAALNDDGNIVITYSRIISAGSADRRSYVTVVSPDGKVILKETELGLRLNENGDILYRDGCIYFAEGDRVNNKPRITVYKIDVENPTYLDVYYKDKATFTGKEIKQKVTIKYNGKTLKSGTDYTLKYTNNVAKYNNKLAFDYPARIHITGKGDIFGFTRQVTFKIK